MKSHTTPRPSRCTLRSRFATLLTAIVPALAAFALPATTHAQSLVFSDLLRGPSSPNLSIPAEYSYTAQGLQRTSSGIYRSMVKTVSGAHLTSTQFTAEVAVNVAFGDIAFVGLGQGVANPNYGPNEPTNSFVFRIHNLNGYRQIDTAVAAGFSSNQFITSGGIGNYPAGSTTVFRVERNGDNVTLSVPALSISRTYSLATYGAAMGLTNTNTHFFFGSGNTGTRFSNASVSVPVVFASGLSSVTGWDPIFLDGPVVPDNQEGKPVPSVGYNDPRWTNPHAAFVFPLGAHPWEGIAPFNFSANWINSWAGNGQLNRNPGLDSNRHGKISSSAGWAGSPYYGVPNQSFTKYSTTVYGEGEFVLQFLADNASWIYVDGALIGYQDYSWQTSGTGRYLITLNGAGAHDLGFVIWDGGGLAGGKFRLETRAAFETNNPGVPLPPAPATVTLSNLTHTYSGLPKSATVTTAPGGLTTSVTYNGSTTPPTDAGSYNVVATVTSPNYLGSATGTLTIGKATATITLGNLEHTYDGAVKSATATSTNPSGLSVIFNSGNSFTNAGSYPVIASISNPNYNASTTTGTLNIAKANATITVNGYTGIYDAAAHGAAGSAAGVGGVNLSSGLSLGAAFTDAPGGTANWTFSGGTNYNDATGTALIAIAKADATLTVNGYTGTYDAVAHNATGSAKGVGGVDLSAGLNLGASFTDAPGGTANWTFTGGINYNSTNGTAVIAIAKADATVTVTGYTGTYDALPHSATGSAKGLGGVDLSAGLNLGAAFTNAPGGTANWTFSGGTNYNNASGTAVIAITKANATITVNGYTGIYDGAAHGASGSATGVGGVNLSSEFNLGAKFTNVPGGTANWTFAGGTNYNNANGPAAIVINKANATVIVTPYNVEYDAQPHSATVASITGANGETGATVGAVTLYTTHTAVGVYSDTWSFTGASNYNNIGATPITDRIKDTTAPTITSLSTNAPTLWPPNHKMVAVTVSATATDLVGVTSLKIISATSNEPDNGLGDGDTANDIQITGNLALNLRAERGGGGSGRIYTIVVEARDLAGNASTRAVTVLVPHSQGK